MDPEEWAPHLDVSKREVTQAVVARCMATKEVIDRPHDKEHGHADDGQDLHGEVRVFQQHGVVKGDARRNLVDLQPVDGAQPTPHRLRWRIRRYPLERVVGIHDRVAQAEDGEHGEAEERKGNVRRERCDEGREVPCSVLCHTRWRRGRCSCGGLKSGTCPGKVCLQGLGGDQLLLEQLHLQQLPIRVRTLRNGGRDRGLAGLLGAVTPGRLHKARAYPGKEE
mmetsp:Transcript_92766/g.207722  ORF Transcript_92766/g.207722 Transcript_92766/m.207722 type:complete len:223 (-) Transcript_92766:77-745(-)